MIQAPAWEAGGGRGWGSSPLYVGGQSISPQFGPPSVPHIMFFLLLPWCSPCADACSLLLNDPKSWPQGPLSYPWWFAVNICLVSSRLGQEDDRSAWKAVLAEVNVSVADLWAAQISSEAYILSQTSVQALALTSLSASPQTPVVNVYFSVISQDILLVTAEDIHLPQL